MSKTLPSAFPYLFAVELPFYSFFSALLGVGLFFLAVPNLTAGEWPFFIPGALLFLYLFSRWLLNLLMLLKKILQEVDYGIFFEGKTLVIRKSPFKELRFTSKDIEKWEEKTFVTSQVYSGTKETVLSLYLKNQTKLKISHLMYKDAHLLKETLAAWLKA